MMMNCHQHVYRLALEALSVESLALALDLDSDFGLDRLFRVARIDDVVASLTVLR